MHLTPRVLLEPARAGALRRDVRAVVSRGLPSLGEHGEGEDVDVDQLHGASDPKPGFDSPRTALIADKTQGGVQGLSRLGRGEVGEELGFHVACVVGREAEGNHRKAIDEHGDADGRV